MTSIFHIEIDASQMCASILGHAILTFKPFGSPALPRKKEPPQQHEAYPLALVILRKTCIHFFVFPDGHEISNWPKAEPRGPFTSYALIISEAFAHAASKGGTSRFVPTPRLHNNTQNLTAQMIALARAVTRQLFLQR